MKLTQNIINKLRERSALSLQSSYDCKYLVADIEKKTGKLLGISTIKRMLGFFPDDREPRTSTLDIIAEYLGYENWSSMYGSEGDMFSAFENGPDCVNATDLEKGDRLELTYQPNRVLTLEYEGNERFSVLSSVNSKLQKGDQLSLSTIILGFPLLVKEVLRGKDNLGAYSAAKQGGISTIKLLNE